MHGRGFVAAVAVCCCFLTVVVGATGEGHDGKHAPRIHTAVPLGASPKAASHPSEFGSDSDEEDGGAVQALTHV